MLHLFPEHQNYCIKRKKMIPKNKTIVWLESQDTYTLYKPLRRRYPRRFYNLYNIDDLWEADIMDL